MEIHPAIIFRLLHVLRMPGNKRKFAGGHPLSRYAKSSEKLTFLTPWYVHVRLRIRGLEMSVFRKILRTYLMDDPLRLLLVNHTAKKIIIINNIINNPSTIIIRVFLFIAVKSDNLYCATVKSVYILVWWM